MTQYWQYELQTLYDLRIASRRCLSARLMLTIGDGPSLLLISVRGSTTMGERCLKKRSISALPLVAPPNAYTTKKKKKKERKYNTISKTNCNNIIK